MKNLGADFINGVFIGTAEKHDAELDQMPLGCNDLNDESCACSINAPQGWSGCVGLQEESDLHFLEFRPNRESFAIAPSATVVFSVSLSGVDPTHETPVVWIIRDRGCSFVGHAALVK